MDVEKLKIRGYPKLLKTTKKIFILLVGLILLENIIILTKTEEVLSEYDKTIKNILLAVENYIDNKELEAETEIKIKDLIDNKFLLKKGCYNPDDILIIEKKENNYLLKINTNCNKNNESTILQLGKYKYCKTTICVKKAISIE